MPKLAQNKGKKLGCIRNKQTSTEDTKQFDSCYR
jgi:hypothetical protein